MTTSKSPHVTPSNGAALAAFLAAAIGAFTLGLVVILNEAGAVTVPAVYGPAGGVSGRTSVAVAAWLLSWTLLHTRWRSRDLHVGRVYALSLILTALGVVLNLPPLWKLL